MYKIGALLGCIAFGIAGMAQAGGGPDMTITLDGLGGNPTTTVMWQASLGKVKNGEQVGSRTPYSIWDCEVKFKKVYKVKESGSKFRGFEIDVSDITNDFTGKINDEYEPWKGNGNSDGRTQILSRNSGKTSGLEEALLDRVNNAYNVCESESLSKGWMLEGGMCQPQPGIKLTGRCKYAEYPGGNYNPSQKKTATYTIPLD
jgi:hypothetical protein